MEQFKNNKLFWIVIVFTVINVGVLVAGTVIVNRVADKVIERLQKDYSPSPYGPGLDPDRVNINAARDKAPVKTSYAEEQGNWTRTWEESRGFSN